MFHIFSKIHGRKILYILFQAGKDVESIQYRYELSFLAFKLFSENFLAATIGHSISLLKCIKELRNSTTNNCHKNTTNESFSPFLETAN